LRVATIGLVTPVLLMLAGMVFWPERLGAPGVILVSNERFVGTLVVEIFLVATLGTWLWRQGWRPHRTATTPFAPRDVLRGIGVWLAAYVSYAVWALLWFLVVPGFTWSAYAVQHVGQPTLWVVISVSAVNAVFEEMLWLGLGVAALNAAGVRLGVAATISLALRVLVHAYQGPLALVAILPLGAVFTTYYVRTRRLWPVVVAHAAQDLLALAVIMLRSSGRGAV
jgi:membrane protease YdiL (CAAX protease family)